MKNNPILTPGERIDLQLRLFFGALVSLGCFFVIKPFLTAIILAAVLAVVTWPLFTRARTSFADSPTFAAVTMVLLIIICVLIPISFLSVTVAQQLPRAIQITKEWINTEVVLPNWLSEIPTVGPWLHEQLLFGLDSATLSKTIHDFFDPISSWLLNAAVNLSSGIVQLVLVTFVVFFFYRDGAWFADRVKELLERIGGGLSTELYDILVNTTRSVVLGLACTALGQGLVAGIGFWIAGIPGILILSLAVCVLSIIPIGPPLVWGPAALWLYAKGETGMAIFLLVWGSLVVSSVDNFIKPLVIARGTSLPLALIFLGVFGGVLAFGFLGLILGPILLAVGVAMFRAWLKNPRFIKKVVKSAQALKEARANADKEVQQAETALSTMPSTKAIGEMTTLKTKRFVRQRLKRIGRKNSN